jgi:uncharacterized LabA/DUF88 family protein
VSPRLRSNWRPPVRSGDQPSESPTQVTENNRNGDDATALVPNQPRPLPTVNGNPTDTVSDEPFETSVRPRRTATRRPRTTRNTNAEAPGDASNSTAAAQAEPESVGAESSSPAPARTRRRRSTAKSEASEEPAGAQPQTVAQELSVPVTSDTTGISGSDAVRQVPAVRVWQVEPASQDYEPLPPPTKRKAPRNPVSQPHADQTENAIDWALGRSTAFVPAEEPKDDSAVQEAGLEPRRRRSRRGRRGRGGTSEIAGTLDSTAATRTSAPEEGAIRPAARPAPRDDGNRSQLSTFEGLVARQNVVLDALLAKVASFSSIEHALLAIERRLSSQGFGATGAAAPRVGIFVDVPNIIYAAERIGATIDFGKLLHLLSRGRELVRASAYAPISDDPMQRLESQKFVQPFAHRGYRIVTKPLKRFSDGTMKGNFDVELAMDVLTMSDRLDVVSLVSGDGDFSRLVEIVGSRGVRVEVVAFGASTSSELRAICDDYLDIQEHLADLT